MKRLFTLAACGLLLAGPASASVTWNAHPDLKAVKYKAGIIRADGTIANGTGFSSSHTGTGQYTLTFPAGTFKGCPAMAVNGFGIASKPVTGIIYGESCNGNSGTFSIRLYKVDGTDTLQDNDFQFVIVTT